MSRLIRCPIVENLTGLSRSTIYRLEKAGAFPKRKPLTKNIIAWDEQAVLEWVKSKIESACSLEQPEQLRKYQNETSPAPAA